MVTPKEKFVTLLVSLSELTGKTLNPVAAAMYTDEAKRIGYDTALSALLIYFRKNKFPAIDDLARSAQGEGSEESEAAVIAGEIRAAVQRFGYYQPAEACEALGKRAWWAVEHSGGWQAICDTKTDDWPTVASQIRKIGRVAIAKQAAGLLECKVDKALTQKQAEQLSAKVHELASYNTGENDDK